VKAKRYIILTSLVVFLVSSASLAVAAKVDYSLQASKEAQRAEASWSLLDDLGLTANVPEVEPNDTCPGQVIACGDVLTQATLTLGDVDYINFSAVAGEVLILGTESAGGLDPDTEITLLQSDCTTILATDDDSGPGVLSLITFVAPSTATYVLQIQGVDAFTEGDYVAYVSCTPRVPGDICATAPQISCGSFSFAGTTVGALNDYIPGPEPNACTGFTAEGYDVVYVINESVFTLSVFYTSSVDGSIYLVTDCSDPEGSCVVGSDDTLDGQTESFNFTSTAGGPYYLIVDNFIGGLGLGGTYTLSGYLDCPPGRWVDSGQAANQGNSQGAAWGDFNDDGDFDLYLSNYDQNNNLYQNTGAGTFNDLPIPPLNDIGNGRGVAWGDFDNDDDLDLYLANAGSANKLFENDGAGGFTDVTAPPLDDAGDARGVAWGDHNNDGNLDLYLVNAFSSNKLFQGDGAGGFTDVTSAPLDNADIGTGVAWGDFDDDGDLDIYLANHGSANKLFRNEGAGIFTDVAIAILNDAGNGRGVAWGDYNNDEHLDLFLTNSFSANRLFENDGAGGFTEVVSPPLNNTEDGRGVAWGDWDNDGDLDLYVANAYTPNQLFENDGAGGFAEVTSVPLGDLRAGHAVATADYDDDGDVDIYLANAFAANKLFRNDLPAGNHWLHVDLVGLASNRNGIGARIRVVVGGVTQIREVSGGSGYLSQNSLTAEFGLGTATLVDTVQVLWPSGTTDDSLSVAVDQKITLIEGGGGPTGIDDGTGPLLGRFALYQNVPNPFNPSTVIRYHVVDGGAAVKLSIYDVNGRLVRTLFDGYQTQGDKRVLWNGTNEDGQEVATGVYLYRLASPGFVETHKMVLLK